MYVFDFDIKHTHEILNETIRVQFLKEHDHMRQGHLILSEYLLRYRVTALHYEVVKPFLHGPERRLRPRVQQDQVVRPRDPRRRRAPLPDRFPAQLHRDQVHIQPEPGRPEG